MAVRAVLYCCAVLCCCCRSCFLCMLPRRSPKTLFYCPKVPQNLTNKMKYVHSPKSSQVLTLGKAIYHAGLSCQRCVGNNMSKKKLPGYLTSFLNVEKQRTNPEYSSTRQMLRNSYIWPDWNSYVRLRVFHTIFSTKRSHPYFFRKMSVSNS